jgi:hypothetical protein
MMTHNSLVLFMTLVWLTTNFLGVGFTVRRIRHRRDVAHQGVSAPLPIASPDAGMRRRRRSG